MGWKSGRRSLEGDAFNICDGSRNSVVTQSDHEATISHIIDIHTTTFGS